GYTKGNATQLARRLAPKGLVPIFIGDDTTDEDAFRALKGGITVRVGRSSKSAARFFVRTRADVDALLETLSML
ncbi:MAG TPA: trehalose-phosphatase, partial [Candidatus Paceibacterota bacterium]